MDIEAKREIVAKWEASGQSAKKFAKVSGVSESSLYAYRHTLKKSGLKVEGGGYGSVGKALTHEEIRDRRANRPHVTAPLLTFDEIEALDKEFRDSGKSLKAYAKSKGLSWSSFSSWRSRLKRKRNSAPPPPGPSHPTQALPSISADVPIGNLHCPVCGCDIITEYEKLVLKLRAMGGIRL